MQGKSQKSQWDGAIFNPSEKSPEGIKIFHYFLAGIKIKAYLCIRKREDNKSKFLSTLIFLT